MLRRNLEYCRHNVFATIIIKADTLCQTNISARVKKQFLSLGKNHTSTHIFLSLTLGHVWLYFDDGITWIWEFSNLTKVFTTYRSTFTPKESLATKRASKHSGDHHRCVKQVLFSRRTTKKRLEEEGGQLSQVGIGEGKKGNKKKRKKLGWM